MDDDHGFQPFTGRAQRLSDEEDPPPGQPVDQQPEVIDLDQDSGSIGGSQPSPLESYIDDEDEEAMRTTSCDVMTSMKSVAYAWFLKLPTEDQYSALKDDIMLFVEDTTCILSCAEKTITRPPSYDNMVKLVKSLRERFDNLKENYLVVVLDNIRQSKQPVQEPDEEPVQEPTNKRRRVTGKTPDPNDDSLFL